MARVCFALFSKHALARHVQQKGKHGVTLSVVSTGDLAIAAASCMSYSN